MTAARGVEAALKIIAGRWKLLILFHLFGGRVLRFSDLEKAIPAISQKMLIQQLRQLEVDGMVRRVVYPQVPPKVEYALTELGAVALPGARRPAPMGRPARGAGGPGRSRGVGLTGALDRNRSGPPSWAGGPATLVM